MSRTKNRLESDQEIQESPRKKKAKKEPQEFKPRSRDSQKQRTMLNKCWRILKSQGFQALQRYWQGQAGAFNLKPFRDWAMNRPTLRKMDQAATI